MSMVELMEGRRQAFEDTAAEARGRGEEPSLLLKVEPDATRLTRCSRSFLYEEIAAGRLKTIRLGRSVRIRREDLLAWIEERAALNA